MLTLLQLALAICHVGREEQKMIRKRGKYFAFEFMEELERHFGTFNGRGGQPLARSKREARDYESSIRLQLRAGTYGRESGIEDFGMFFDRVYMAYSKEHKADWKHDDFRGEVLKQFFAGKTFGQITPMLIVQYINERLKSVSKRGRVRSPVTIYKEVRLLSSVFTMAIQEVAAKVNPCLSIPKSVKKKLPARNKRDRYLSHEEEMRLFAHLTGRRSHLWRIARFDLETGLRKSELCRLEVEHVNLGDATRFVTITGRRVEVRPGELLVVRSKNGKPRTVPLTSEARRIAVFQMADVTTRKYLFTSFRTGGMTTEVKTAFTGAVRDAGLEDFRFHDLRHTFATRLNESGVDPFTIRDLLGHSTTSMSSDYTHSSPELRRAAIVALSRERPQGVENSVKIPA
jgi:integrase